MKHKEAQSKHELNELIKKRWSPRAFSDKEISKDLIEKLLEAASWSPSSMNEQPWIFKYAVKGSEAFDSILNTLAPNNQTWARHASVLVICNAKIKFSNGNVNRHAGYDLGAAVMQLSLQALAEGIYIHQMGGYDRVKLNEVFANEEDTESYSVLALGYLGNPTLLPEALLQREQATRSRKTLEEFAIAL